VLANPKAVKNATQSAKTDKLDARTLAKLLAAGFLPEVWTPDEQARVLRRRISRRARLVRQRTREKEPGARDPDPQPQAASADG
jgi:transposase